MKKVFESPKFELCEFVVAARLSGSGLSGHDNGNNSTCSKKSAAGGDPCVPPANRNSGPPTGSCTVY